MSYLGVEFSENGSIGLIHSSWLTPLKREVFWPPYKTSNLFNKALVVPEEPNQNSWNIYPIKRIFFESDEFEKAKKKLKRCEETSDIQSSESDFGFGKRTKIVTKLISESSSDEEPIRNKLPRPPNVSRKLFKNRATPTSSKSTSEENRIYSTEIVRENSALTPIREDSPRVQHGDINVSANNLDKIFQEIRKLREELKEIKGLLKLSRNSSVGISNLPDDIPVEFPLKIISNLQTLEEYLSAEEKLNGVASYLSSLGGNGTTAQVNRILRFVMTDELATQYNFAGQRNNKQPFGNTKLNSVIIRAIQIKSPAITQVQIQNAVKIWLKHAKQRMEKKLRPTATNND